MEEGKNLTTFVARMDYRRPQLFRARWMRTIWLLLYIVGSLDRDAMNHGSFGGLGATFHIATGTVANTSAPTDRPFLCQP